MHRFISKISTTRVLIGIFIFNIYYHLGALLNVVPMDMVMGGRYPSFEMMQFWEIGVISSNIFLTYFLFVAHKHFRKRTNPLPRYVPVISGILFTVLLFTTVGNVLSKNPLEAWIFTPISLFSTLLFFRLTRRQ